MRMRKTALTGPIETALKAEEAGGSTATHSYLLPLNRVARLRLVELWLQLSPKGLEDIRRGTEALAALTADPDFSTDSSEGYFAGKTMTVHEGQEPSPVTMSRGALTMIRDELAKGLEAGAHRMVLAHMLLEIHDEIDRVLKAA